MGRAVHWGQEPGCGEKVMFRNVETSLWNGFLSLSSTAETTYEVKNIITLLRTATRWYRKHITITDKLNTLKVKLWEERFLGDKNLAIGKKVLFRNLDTNLWNGIVALSSTAETTYEVQYIINLLCIKCANYVSC